MDHAHEQHHRHHAHGHHGTAAADDLWFDELWPFVREHLPGPPSHVVEIGCGRSGGFVPRLLREGHQAVGVDPSAPEGPAYRQVGIEEYVAAAPVDAVVASLSLHHLGDLPSVLEAVHATLRPGGLAIVMEWAVERFDRSTAEWCFTRLPDDRPDAEPDWLTGHRDAWQSSGLPWEEYLRGWLQEAGLHTGDEVLRALDARFEPVRREDGPYLFRDLPGLAPTDEQDVIDAGQIQPLSLRYVGRRR